MLAAATLVDGSHADQSEEAELAELVVEDELASHSPQVEELADVVLWNSVSFNSLQLESSVWSLIPVGYEQLAQMYGGDTDNANNGNVSGRLT